MKKWCEKLKGNLFFVSQFALDDFKTKYAGSVLGFFWAFVQPVITVLIYWFIFQIGFKNGDVQQERVLKHSDTGIVFNIDPNMMTFYIKHADGRTFFAFGCFFVHSLQKLYYEHTHVPLVLEWAGI